MPSNFVVIHGDNPVEITPSNPYEFKFGFDEAPDSTKPAIIYLGVQGLVETSEVRINGSIVGCLYPSDSYWITQTVNISMGFKLNDYSYATEGDDFETNYESGVNSLRLESVSQPFRVKDIVLHYPLL